MRMSTRRRGKGGGPGIHSREENLKLEEEIKLKNKINMR